MVINPLCDMPWDIYLDYLADQGFDELRNIDCELLFSIDDFYILTCHNWYGTIAYGCGLVNHDVGSSPPNNRYDGEYGFSHGIIPAGEQSGFGYEENNYDIHIRQMYSTGCGNMHWRQF